MGCFPHHLGGIRLLAGGPTSLILCVHSPIDQPDIARVLVKEALYSKGKVIDFEYEAIQSNDR